MEEIIKTFGMCLLYMLPLFLLAAVAAKMLSGGGIISDAVLLFMNGLTG